MPSPLADPVKLPCGLVLPNRLSKVQYIQKKNHKVERGLYTNSSQAAMAEMIAKTNKPNQTLSDAYDQWSQGGWGSILTGARTSTPKPTIRDQN
jgi:hypothetical protein